MPRRIHADAIDLVKRFEGRGDGDRSTPALDPYICPAGYWTLGYGSLYDVRGVRVSAATMSIGDDEALILLDRDLSAAERSVDRLITVELGDRRRGALASFVHNLGAGQLQASTLRRVINAGEWDRVAGQWVRFHYGGGRSLPGLVRRRAAELELWNAG